MPGEYVLIVSGSGERPANDIQNAVNSHARTYKTRSLDTRAAAWEWVFEVCMKEGGEDCEDKMLTTLNVLGGVDQTTLLAPKLRIPV